jgi:predicted DNA-binding transcriptional regulator YafY
MSKRETIARYSLIIKKLRKHPATFNEISDYLELESELQEYNFVVSKRTFQRDLEDIRSLYNIDIQYDPSDKVYRIDFELEPELNERILEAYDTFHALNLTDRLSDHIHFENRKSRGTENLYGLLHAIKNQVQIKFTYLKFGEDKPTHRITEPYALKEFKNRWYLLANNLKDDRIKSFALDRLTELKITKRPFQSKKDYAVNEHFKYSFGIISPDNQTPQEVVLSFQPFQGKYIKSLPLHDTQQILVDNKEEVRVALKVFITHDFIMEMLSHGDDVKVIQPESLIQQLKSRYENALKLYKG